MKNAFIFLFLLLSITPNAFPQDFFDGESISSLAMMYQNRIFFETANLYTTRNKMTGAQNKIIRNEKAYKRQMQMWDESHGRATSKLNIVTAENVLNLSKYDLDLLHKEEAVFMKIIAVLELQFKEASNGSDLRLDLAKAYVSYYQALINQLEVELQRATVDKAYWDWVNQMRTELSKTPAGCAQDAENSELAASLANGLINQTKSKIKAAKMGEEKFTEFVEGLGGRIL